MHYPVRKRNRLPGFDYSSANVYFITICTHQKQCIMWSHAPTVSRVVAQMKGAAVKAAGTPLWQKGFHDHIVRTESDLQGIWAYIDGNPYAWEQDCFYLSE